MAKNTSKLGSIDGWLKKRKIKNTSQIKIPKRLVDQVIGQDEAVEVIKKAGSWLQFEDKKLGQGMEASKEFLRENPEIVKKIKKAIMSSLS